MLKVIGLTYTKDSLVKRNAKYELAPQLAKNQFKQVGVADVLSLCICPRKSFRSVGEVLPASSI